MSQNSSRPTGENRRTNGTAKPGAAKPGAPTGQSVAAGAARAEGVADERRELKAGIEQTRQDLGETVEALAAKADVPSRVRDKATRMREQATGTLATLTHTVRERAPQVREQAAVPIAKASKAIPEPARRTAVRATRQTAQAAGERPGVLYAAAGTCAVAGLWMWKRSR
jgi:hypothetical protein